MALHSLSKQTLSIKYITTSPQSSLRWASAHFTALSSYHNILAPQMPIHPDQDILQLLRHRKPIYILGERTASGYTRTNSVVTRIFDGTLQLIGLHFPTFVNARSASIPDIVLANRHSHLNIHLTHGAITTSDHLPTIARYLQTQS